MADTLGDDGGAGLIDGVEISAGGEEQLDDVGTGPACGLMQGDLAFVVLQVNRCASVEERFGDIEMAMAGRDYEGRRFLSASFVSFGAVSEQRLHDLGRARLGGEMQRRHFRAIDRADIRAAIDEDFRGGGLSRDRGPMKRGAVKLIAGFDHMFDAAFVEDE